MYMKIQKVHWLKKSTKKGIAYWNILYLFTVYHFTVYRSIVMTYGLPKLTMVSKKRLLIKNDKP